MGYKTGLRVPDYHQQKVHCIRRAPTIIVERAVRFDAGVTCIQSHPKIEHLMVVGSCDNAVRLFDARKPLTPLIQTDVGGGAWRVKWHPSPSRVHDLLVAAMHDGFKIVSFRFRDFGSISGSVVAGSARSG
jgi:diphthine methyl ester acylhydrolase